MGEILSSTKRFTNPSSQKTTSWSDDGVQMTWAAACSWRQCWQGGGVELVSSSLTSWTEVGVASERYSKVSRVADLTMQPWHLCWMTSLLFSESWFSFSIGTWVVGRMRERCWREDGRRSVELMVTVKSVGEQKEGNVGGWRRSACWNERDKGAMLRNHFLDLVRILLLTEGREFLRVERIFEVCTNESIHGLLIQIHDFIISLDDSGSEGLGLKDLWNVRLSYRRLQWSQIHSVSQFHWYRSRFGRTLKGWQHLILDLEHLDASLESSFSW